MYTDISFSCFRRRQMQGVQGFQAEGVQLPSAFLNVWLQDNDRLGQAESLQRILLPGQVWVALDLE